MTIDIEKGDNLFELIFELDRRLQTAQNHSSPSANFLEAYKYLDSVLSAAKDKQPDVVDTVFLKLIDFFIKCNCNYKRSLLSTSLSQNNSWLYVCKSKSEALRRLCQLWDQSILYDFETCSQILIFMSSCSELFFNQTASYGLFYESFSLLNNSVVGSVIGPAAILTCSRYFQMLFDSLNHFLRTKRDEIELDELISLAKFASSTILPVLTEVTIAEDNIVLERYRIIIICHIIIGAQPPVLPEKLKETFSNLLIYF